MGPITLFDKSFLQSLSVDESVWFGNYFMPVTCPIFYVETLADLEKAVRQGRTQEQEVGIIASKFPELSGGPCVHHSTLILGELLGYEVPLDGRIPRDGARAVTQDGKQGAIYDESPEEVTFQRWQKGQFLEIERSVAKVWREALKAINLNTVASRLRKIGVDASTCRSLHDCRELSKAIVTGRDKPYERMAVALEMLSVPHQYHQAIVERWSILGCRSLTVHAPYTAFVLEVQLFFQFSLAAHQIGDERSSNSVDIAYLYYLPFCTLFISSDVLHRRCAPLFTRSDQEFVWGTELKQDLARINQHFLQFPEAVRDLGVMNFGHAPPNIDGSMVRALRAKYMRSGYDDEQKIEPPKKGDEAHKDIFDGIEKWQAARDSALPKSNDDPDAMIIKRNVHKKKGSWYQVPKDLKRDPDKPT